MLAAPVHKEDHGLLLMSPIAESVSTGLFCTIFQLSLNCCAVDPPVMNFTLYMRFSSFLSDILAGEDTQGALRNIENVVCMYCETNGVTKLITFLS